MKKEINAVGIACPQPVILQKRIWPNGQGNCRNFSW